MTTGEDLWALAQQNREVLRFSTYIVASTVTRELATRAGLERAAALLRQVGVTRVWLEVYRGQLPEVETLRQARDFFRAAGIEAGGGFTPVAGRDGKVVTREDGRPAETESFGQPATHGWYWLCYSHERTRQDVAEAMRRAGALFDEIIIDDFLATFCQCESCRAAMGSRSPGQFRCDQLAEFARDCLLGPAKAANPQARVIIKYPQWYDRFHDFGYDVRRHPQQFNGVWVGTETRDPEVCHVEQTQGYMNYLWLESLAGERVRGAWFDTHRCYPEVYVEQAVNSVLAGAPEITLFDYAPERFAPGNPFRDALAAKMPDLYRLAALVRGRKRAGVPAYKPPDSDPGDECFLFDYLGAFGIPVLPQAQFPAEARVAVFGAHATSDPDFARKLEALLARGATVLLTSGALSQLGQEPALLSAAGLGAPPVHATGRFAHVFWTDGRRDDPDRHVEIGGALNPTDAEVLATALVDGVPAPVMTVRTTPAGGRVIALSARTFSFWPGSPRVVIPQPVSLVNLPRGLVNRLHNLLLAPLGLSLWTSLTRVAMSCYEDGLMVLQNFNDRPAEARIEPSAAGGVIGAATDALTGEALPREGDGVRVALAPRSVKALILESQ